MTMTGDFTFKDDGYIELVLRMLGLMCDNQHSDIQVKGEITKKHVMATTKLKKPRLICVIQYQVQYNTISIF